MSHTNEYLEWLVLAHKYGDRGYDLIDYAIDSGEDVPVRNMCAKVHPALIERVDEACNLLGISKRRFIESAVAHAVHETEELFAKHFPGEKS